MVSVIKLSINGDIDEVNIYTKKSEQFKLESFLSKLNNEQEIEELYQWDLEKLSPKQYYDYCKTEIHPLEQMYG